MNKKKLTKLVETIVTLKAKLKCPICLDVMQDIIELDCGHKYCKECYQEHKSTQKQASCPLCKRSVKRRSTIYTDNYANVLGKFVYNCCENIKNIYKCNVEQLQKQLKEGTELLQNKDNVLQQNVSKNISFTNPSTSKDANHKEKKISASKNEGVIRKTNKRKTKRDGTLKENCESAFDKLMGNLPATTFNRKGTKRVYMNRKKNSELEYSILEFDNSENKTAVLQWLNDTRNKFDRLSQTQNITDENVCEVPVIDLVSISQINRMENKPRPVVAKTRRGRAKSLEIEVKKIVPTQKKQHSQAKSISLENYNIDNNTEEEELVKKVEEKVILDLIEDELLDTLEDEMQGAKDEEFDIKSKRYTKSKEKSKPLCPTFTTGWERLTKMKKAIKKNERMPRQLNITLQSIDEPKTDKPSTCKSETITSSNKKHDDLKVETIARNDTISIESKSKPSQDQVRTVLDKNEPSTSDMEINTLKTNIDKQNGDLKQSIVRNEEMDIENRSRPPEGEQCTKSDSDDEISEAREAQKLSYDLEKLEDYITKNIEIIDKNTSEDASPQSPRSQQIKENTDIRNSDVEENQLPTSNIHEEKQDSSCILLDMLYSMPTQKISHSDSPKSKRDDEIIVIEDDVTEIESKKSNVGGSCAIHSGTDNVERKQDSSLDEVEKLYSCPTQKVHHTCEKVDPADILAKEYSSKDGLLHLFEECLEECITNLKSADATVRNHFRTLQFYLSKLKLLHKNDNEVIEENSCHREVCDAEMQAVVDVTSETVQTEYNGNDIGIQTEDFNCISCSVDLNKDTVSNSDRFVCQDAKTSAGRGQDETKVDSSPTLHQAASSKSGTPRSKPRSQYADFTSTLDNLNFETQELTTNQGAITKISPKSSYHKSHKPSEPQTRTPLARIEENIPGSVLVCSLNSNDAADSKGISRKSSCNADRSTRFKRIKLPTSDSGSEDEVPAKRKCNRFLRHDLTVEFQTHSEGMDVKNSHKTPVIESQDSEGINYDEYLAEVMKKYEDDNFSANSSWSLTKPKVCTPKQEEMRKCEEMISNIHRNVNTTKTVPELSIASAKDSFKTALEENFTDALTADDDDFMNEENLLKIENDIREYERTVKPQSSEISDIITETEQIEPLPKKRKRTVNSKVHSELKNQDGLEEKNVFLDGSHLNLSNKLCDVLENVHMGKLPETSYTSTNLNKEKKINILSNVKVKSQDKKEEINVEEDDLFSDEDIVETTPQKKVDSFAERSAYSQMMGSISLIDNIDNALLVPPTETDNFDYDILPLPPPPDFRDDVVDVRSTSSRTVQDDNTTNDNTTVIDLNKSSLTPDSLSQFMFRNKRNANKIMSPCIMEFARENKSEEKHSSAKDMGDLSKQWLNDLSLTPDKLPQQHQRTMIHSTPMVGVDSIRESLGFSPITTRKSQKMGVTEMAEAAKYTPLTTVARQTSQKQLFASTPGQRSMWSYVKPSQPDEGTSKSKPCIACTRLVKDKIKLISKLTSKKLATYNPQFDETVTHMIVMTNERNCVKDYTIKFVSAVAAGIWVLRFEWMEECLSKNCIVPEEPFEVLDISGLPGPKTSRLTRKQNPLFRGYKFFCAEPFLSTTRQEIENILKMLDGKVLDDVEDLLENDGNIGIVIGEGHATQDFEQYERWVEKYKTVTVDIEWLSKCVGQYKILSIRPFVWCSEDNLGDLGYPSILTETVPLSFTETY